MNKEQIDHVLSSSFRVKAEYRDQYNFIVRGIILSIKVFTDEIGDYLFIDNYQNKVYISRLIKVKSI